MAEWFDPGDLRCKAPYGAVPSGTEVTVTLRPARTAGFSRGVLTARWEFDGDRVTQTVLPWTGLDGDRDLFSAVLDTAGYVGLVWYTLRLERLDGGEERAGEFQLTVYDPAERVPGWFGEGVTYQIFPDRFRRLSIPDPAGMAGGRTVHPDWTEEPEYRPDGRGEVRNRDFFGGSLPGIAEKLPYLHALGVETLYLCPIFEAAENHRYGTADYEKIDPMLGTGEDFSALCRQAHALGMRVMLDGVFNHMGFVSRYFNGDGFYPEPGAHQSRESPYYGWFTFQHWPDRYSAWWGIYSLPTANKASKAWLDYITGEDGIIRRWLRAGADGWRLDVADELPDAVVAAIHAAARAEKPEAVIIGEVWEDGSNKVAYSVRRRHLLGGHCDGLMNYPLRSALIDYLLGGDAEAFRETMEGLRQNYPPWALASAMNALGTHDTPRILTLLGTGGDGKNRSRDWRAAHRMTAEQRARGEARLRLGALLLYAFPGSPTVYYGDEAGMEGFEDPFNRRTFPWGGENEGLTAWFAALGRARRALAPLRRGAFSWLTCAGGLLSFARTLGEETVAAAANTGAEAAELALPWGERLTLPAGEGRLILRRNGETMTIL